ncbi:acyl-CoA/acyl-ACP dehydrogenase [Myxococcota bacterium]|nr:acyl-CoA/acyl-ACP dehydrogenase [Myxococcota bacterium]
MDVDLSEDQEFFRETTRKFLETEIPVENVRQLADNPAGFDRDWWRRGCEMGWTSMLVPEEHGGGSLEGEGLLDLVIVAEEMGRLITPGPLLATNVVALAVTERGTEDQKKELLPGIVSGDVLATWALNESGGRWHPESLELEARPVEGGFSLRGTKEPVEAAGHVDQILVTARTENGLTQFLVPSDADGMTITPMESLDLVRRYGSIQFDDVFVPASSVLGEVGQAEDDVERQLQVAIALQLAETVGTVDRIFEVTLEWMFDRHSFGRPLASYQALKHRFADMKLYHEANQAAATAVARAVQHHDEEASLKASSAKSYVGDHATFVLQECVQMHGGLGVTWEYDLHLYLRRATTNQVQYGTPDDHRERIAQLIGMDEESQ